MGGVSGALVLAVAIAAAPLQAQSGQNGSVPPPSGSGAGTPAGTSVVTPPPGYVVGVDDELIIDVWEDKNLSVAAIVLPDGTITLRAAGTLKAAGLTLDQLDAAITKALGPFFSGIEPTVTVVPKAIKSRFVSITGEIGKSGTYQLRHNMTVVDLIAEAGGLSPYAKKNDIQLIRMENGKPKAYTIPYGDISEGKKLDKDMVLLPGDRVIVRD
jgi:polysaccharide export outer membrane protein